MRDSDETLDPRADRDRLSDTGAPTSAEASRAHLPPDAADGPPEAIGGYTIDRIIGEGGMGAVYLAHQKSPEREVALKVIRSDRVSARMLRRFELEAQLLGRLQHPGIAQIYEAGTFETSRGRSPFFAMELVRGEPLDRYCERHELGTRDRLRLFIRIADALHHAHTKGVIHRDLKPGNILVAGEGQPKVLDFGVARVTDADVQVTTIRSDVGQLIGTVPYMSPEQIAADPAAIDVRSDVYGLGVVLYELLAGRLPYDLTRRMIHEAARIIREEEPTPLSTINRTLRGDVETIVAKALEKEPARRYQSAAEMAEDVRRYLGDMPIVARPPSTVYQIRKFAQRHKALMGGLAAVFVVLVAASVVSTALAVRATRAEEKASDSLAEAEATVAFLDDMLAAADPGVLGKDVTVRAVLDDASDALDRQLDQRPLVAARLHSTLGRTYGSLGFYGRGESHLRRAFDIRTRELGPDDPETLRTATGLGRVLRSAGKTDEAESILLATIEALTARGSPRDADTIAAMGQLAGLYAELMQHQRAIPLLRQAARLSAEVKGTDHPDTLDARNNLAMALTDVDRIDEAQRLYADILRIGARTRTLDHPGMLAIRTNHAWFLYHTKRFDAAVETNEALLADFVRVLGEDHPDTTVVMNNLALAYQRVGRAADAEPLLREGLELSVERLGEEHPESLIGLTNYASFLLKSGNAEEAMPHLDRSVTLHRRVLGVAHPGTAHTLRFHAVALVALGRMDEAEHSYLESIDIFESTLGPEAPIVRRVAGNVIDFYEGWGKPAEAAKWRDRYPDAEAPIPAPAG